MPPACAVRVASTPALRPLGLGWTLESCHCFSHAMVRLAKGSGPFPFTHRIIAFVRFVPLLITWVLTVGCWDCLGRNGSNDIVLFSGAVPLLPGGSPQPPLLNISLTSMAPSAFVTVRLDEEFATMVTLLLLWMPSARSASLVLHTFCTNLYPIAAH